MAEMLTAWMLESDHLIPVPAPPWPGWAALVNLLAHSEPQCLHLCRGDSDTFLLRLLWGVDEVRSVEYSVACLTH